MTVPEQAPRLQDEEVLPLMHTLQLEHNSISSSSSSKQRLPLLQRLRGLLKGFTPELLAIALGEAAGVGVRQVDVWEWRWGGGGGWGVFRVAGRAKGRTAGGAWQTTAAVGVGACLWVRQGGGNLVCLYDPQPSVQ
jgi:hypothetical protein